MLAILINNLIGKEKTMSTIKFFICSSFISGGTCEYTESANEEDVISKAVDHLINEHGLIDSPKLREDIRNSLVDA
jgi:predicted small metal-binding protein